MKPNPLLWLFHFSTFPLFRFSALRMDGWMDNVGIEKSDMKNLGELLGSLFALIKQKIRKSARNEKVQTLFYLQRLCTKSSGSLFFERMKNEKVCSFKKLKGKYNCYLLSIFS
jgi:hypothetical protein